MPHGLIDGLYPAGARDLIAYLASRVSKAGFARRPASRAFGCSAFARKAMVLATGGGHMARASRRGAGPWTPAGRFTKQPALRSPRSRRCAHRLSGRRRTPSVCSPLDGFNRGPELPALQSGNLRAARSKTAPSQVSRREGGRAGQPGGAGAGHSSCASWIDSKEGTPSTHTNSANKQQGENRKNA